MTEARTPEEILAELFTKPVKIDGKSVSAREAYLRGLQQKALAGDVESHVELDQLRRACGADEPVVGGCLVIPEAPTLDEWIRLAEEQQRPFRENPGGETN